ncbi:MAG TPA: hypothetical protein PK119_00795 [Candidatus Paceibacterota bacterium]|nr:hypothetical protein [Candidatus Paceibacterota bacterium]
MEGKKKFLLLRMGEKEFEVLSRNYGWVVFSMASLSSVGNLSEEILWEEEEAKDLIALHHPWWVLERKEAKITYKVEL